MKALGFMLIGAVALPASALAQEDKATALVDALNACRPLSESAARLACFDKAVADLAAARERKEVVVIDRAEVQKTRRSLFGFSLPKIKLFGGDDGESIKEINARVTGVNQISYDRWSVTLDDGTRWVTTVSTRGYPPSAGETVKIKSGLLGSYDASFNKRPAIKVKRTG